MKHYLFEFLCGECAGEEFIVGADSYHEAREAADGIARDAGSVNSNGLAMFRYWHELTDEEAEMSGLDEY